MKLNNWQINGLWTTAVVTAFLLGSLRHPQKPNHVPDYKSQTDKTVRSSVLPRGQSGDASAQGVDVASSKQNERGGIVEPALTKGDLEALARDAIKNPNPITRRLAFSKLLEAMTPENAMGIREQLVASGAGGEMWRDFNYSWGAMAGVEAILFAADSEESDLNATLSGWASASPDDAIAFLDNLPENLSADRAGLTESVIAGIADRDTSAATALVLRLAGEDGTESDKLIAIIASKTLRSAGINEAADWSESLPDGALKATAIDRVARSYANKDPEEAAAWVQQFANEDYAARGIEEVADNWARRDPTAAVTWLENLPAGSGQRTGLNSVFGDWEDRDPLAASQHLSEMPESEQRDAAISGFSRGYAWQDPEAAIAWAEVISDPELRTSTLTRAGQAFFRRDPDSARVWLQDSGLPPEAQKQVLEPRRRG